MKEVAELHEVSLGNRLILSDTDGKSREWKRGNSAKRFSHASAVCFYCFLSINSSLTESPHTSSILLHSGGSEELRHQTSVVLLVAHSWDTCILSCLCLAIAYVQGICEQRGWEGKRWVCSNEGMSILPGVMQAPMNKMGKLLSCQWAEFLRFGVVRSIFTSLHRMQ